MTPERLEYINALRDVKSSLEDVIEHRVFRYVDNCDATSLIKFYKELERIIDKESKKRNMYE